MTSKELGNFCVVQLQFHMQRTVQCVAIYSAVVCFEKYSILVGIISKSHGIKGAQIGAQVRHLFGIVWEDSYIGSTQIISFCLLFVGFLFFWRLLRAVFWRVSFWTSFFLVLCLKGEFLIVLGIQHPTVLRKQLLTKSRACSH
jgi:hypothetical protein